MCFSATVSYTASALLVPVGFYTFWWARQLSLSYWPVALIPLIFGTQQGFEGAVWQALDSGGATIPPALGFMFFSHLLWLFWIPLCAFLIEGNPARRRLFMAVMVVGAAAGLSMYLPLLLLDYELSVYVMEQSIVYQVGLIYDGYLPREVVRLIYALIVLVPLLLSTDRLFRRFGVVILASVVFSVLLYSHAFISVWCFFAAILSIYIYYMIRQTWRAAYATEPR